MAAELFSVVIAGEPLEDLYNDVLSLEVHLNDQAPASFRLIVGVPREENGNWRYL